MSPSRDGGFALLIVLWSLVLISLFTTGIVTSGRNAMLLAGNVRQAAQAKAAADGAINEAIYHMLLTGTDRWPADGSTHQQDVGGIPVALRIDSLAGQINPNLASTALLAGLFQAVGAGPGQAHQIAASIIDWRSLALNKQQTAARLAAYRRMHLPYGPPGHDFADLSELASVADMPPALLASALPYLSLYQTGDPNPARAAPVVRQALALSGQTGTKGNVFSGANPVVAIEAVAGVQGKLALRRRAIVSIAGQNGASPFQLLAITASY